MPSGRNVIRYILLIHSLARRPSGVVTHNSGLVVGVRSFPGNPDDEHMLAAQLEETHIQFEDVGKSHREVVGDLGCCGMRRRS